MCAFTSDLAGATSLCVSASWAAWSGNRIPLCQRFCEQAILSCGCNLVMGRSGESVVNIHSARVRAAQGPCEVVPLDGESFPNDPPRQSAAHSAGEFDHVLGRQLHGLFHPCACRPVLSYLTQRCAAPTHQLYAAPIFSTRHEFIHGTATGDYGFRCRSTDMVMVRPWHLQRPANPLRVFWNGTSCKPMAQARPTGQSTKATCFSAST